MSEVIVVRACVLVKKNKNKIIDRIYDLEDFVSLLVDELIHLDGTRRLLRQ